MAKTALAFWHLPGLRLAPEASLALGPMTLRAMAFDEWLELEDPALAYVERSFAHESPAFAVAELPLIDKPDWTLASDVLEPLAEHVDLIWRAAVFALRMPALPDPRRSICYVRIGDEVFRSVGPNERELILGGYLGDGRSPSDALARLQRVHASLAVARVGRDDGIFCALFDALAVGAQPGMTEFDAVLHFVTALEALVNPQGDRPLAKTFAERAGLLFSPAWEHVPLLVELAAMMYEVRSRAVHGSFASGRLERLGQTAERLGGLGTVRFTQTYWACSLLTRLKARSGSLAEWLPGLQARLRERTADETSFQGFRESFPLRFLEDGDG